MKSILTIVLIIGFSHQFTYSQWQQVYGGPYIYSLGTSGDNIFMGNANGVYISSNGGSNWVQTSFSSGLTALSLVSSGTNMLAGTYTAGVYYSTNNGTVWAQSSLNNRAVRSLFTAGSNVYAGTEYNGIYISTNSGVNWVQSAMNNRTVRSFAVLSSNTFAGTDSFGVYISANNGASWTQAGLNSQSVYCMTVIGSEVYAGTKNGVFMSTNNGANWTQSMNFLYFTGLLVSGGCIFAVTYSNGVYVSTDHGLSWQQKNEGLGGNINMGSLIISNNTLFAGSAPNVGIGIYKRQVGELIGITQVSLVAPGNFALSQNYPNPFNPVTSFEFSVPRSAFVKLAVFDVTGRELETLLSQNMMPGTYKADWDASKYSSGVYFYTITSESYHHTRKMILIK